MDKFNIDYTKYTLDELLDCQLSIDKELYPERAQQIDLLIKDRSQQNNDEDFQETPVEELKIDDILDVGKSRNTPETKGFLPNLGYGISEIAFGIIIWFVYGEFATKIVETNSNIWMFIAFASATGIIRGIYHLYKAFKVKKHENQETNKAKDASNVNPKKNDSPINRN